MQLYSLNSPNLRVSFQEAVFNGLSPDNSLYMPCVIPRLDPIFFKQLTEYTFPDICFAVAKAWVGDEIPDASLRSLVNDAVNFDAPLRFLDQNTTMLELFHGPSFAFKDFGARFMSRVMSYFARDRKDLLDILVATSGDTGGAVALGFLNVEGVRVHILFPKGKVSRVQEKQISSHGTNIRAIEVDGTFDDCQAMVKRAFIDPELKASLHMSSANSINIARLIPQSFYYFYAYAQAQKKGFSRVLFSVPSGNFGNLAAGVLAWRMGLPVERFVTATNENDTVPRFFKSGQYQAKPSVTTLSNAMDVGNPSNWPRIMEVFKGDRAAIKEQIDAYSFTDGDTMQAIADLYRQYAYIACPHSAIAWLGATRVDQSNILRIALGTAHPCKFPEVYMPELQAQISIPSFLEGDASKKIAIANNYAAFKQYLLTQSAGNM